ncbi:hypothetical protein D9757_007656 [Collybiopsis confluens]|uniref:Uncharacterized protein n=1 Tax=Collybiopsis confluens TaxID=2823264 RepID=A0A8H5H9Y6_9AGAR|nr:hypothetical protein D9757_007656 [Collybiopsis confluens]
MPASQLQFLVIPVACETLVYGIYLCLAATSMFILLKRGLRNSTSRKVLFCVVLAMFLCSTGTLLSDIMTRLRLGLSGAQTLNSESNIAQVIFVRINVSDRKTFTIKDPKKISKVSKFLLSDYVVIWRCWTLWDTVLIPRLILIFCVLVSTVAGIVNGALFIRDDLVFGSAQNGPKSLILLVPLVITNIFSTSLVAYKAWQHRRHVKENLGRETKKTQIEKILILFVESGVIYCFLGFLALLVSIKTVHVGTATPSLATATLSTLQTHLAGIYPTAVILLVALEKTQESPLGPPRPVRPGHVSSNSTRITALSFAIPRSSLWRDSSDSLEDTESQRSIPQRHSSDLVDKLEKPERLIMKMSN